MAFASSSTAPTEEILYFVSSVSFFHTILPHRMDSAKDTDLWGDQAIE